MILAAVCVLVAGACLAALWLQAVMRGTTIHGHLGDAARAILHGGSPPRWKPRPRRQVDHALIRALEAELDEDDARDDQRLRVDEAIANLERYRRECREPWPR